MSLSSWRRRSRRRFWPSMAKTSSRSSRARSWRNSSHASCLQPMLTTSSWTITTLISALMNISLSLRSKRRSQNLKPKRTPSGTRWIEFRRIRRREFKACSASRICRTSKRSCCKSMLSKRKRSLIFCPSWSAQEYPGKISVAWSKKNAKLTIHLPIWSTI